MITVKRIRKAPAYVTTCPVCHTRIAPQGANVRVVIDFTRERGYAPAELAEVGAWIEVER